MPTKRRKPLLEFLIGELHKNRVGAESEPVGIGLPIPCHFMTNELVADELKSSICERRLIVEWSGAARSRPSSRRRDAISPSVWRSARRKTVRSVSAVVIANAE
jgi:hypothetical protein